MHETLIWAPLNFLNQLVGLDCEAWNR